MEYGNGKKRENIMDGCVVRTRKIALTRSNQISKKGHLLLSGHRQFMLLHTFGYSHRSYILFVVSFVIKLTVSHIQYSICFYIFYTCTTLTLKICTQMNIYVYGWCVKLFLYAVGHVWLSFFVCLCVYIITMWLKL